MLFHGGEPSRAYSFNKDFRFRNLDAQVRLIIEEFSLPSIRVSGTIIDIETSDLEPEEGEIVTLGYISGSKLRSITRTKDLPYTTFIEEIRRELGSLRKPFFAYNKDFEQKWFDSLGIIHSWKDIMLPIKRVINFIRENTHCRVKWSKLHEAFPLRFLHNLGLRDFDVENERIGDLWNEHLKTGNLEPLMMITQHNVLDLLTEATALIWEETMNRLKERMDSMSPSHLIESLNFKCDVCKREVKDSTELVYTHRVERREDGTYRIVENHICKDCFYKLF